MMHLDSGIHNQLMPLRCQTGFINDAICRNDSITVDINLASNSSIWTKNMPHLVTTYCKTVHFLCILISRFWNVEILLYYNLAFPSVLLVFTRPLMGKLNFHRYLISRFYPTRENLMHAKIRFTVDAKVTC